MSKYQDRLRAIASEPVWEILEGDDGPPKDRTVYSSSNLGLIGDCLHKYNLVVNEEAREESRTVGAFRGTVVHRIVHRLHKQAAWDDYKDLAQEVWDQTLNDPEDGADLPWSTDDGEEKLDGVQEDIVQMIRNYAERNRQLHVVGTEVPMRGIVKHPRTGTRYRIAGTIDQIVSEGIKWQIRDLKTFSARPDPFFLARDLQFTTYAWGLQNGVCLIDGEPWRVGQAPDSMVWYHMQNLVPYKRATTYQGVRYQAGDLRGDPSFEVTRSEEDLASFPVEVCRSIQIARMGLFVRQPSGIKCSMCRFRVACTTGSVLKQGVDLGGLDD